MGSRVGKNDFGPNFRIRSLQRSFFLSTLVVLAIGVLLAAYLVSDRRQIEAIETKQLKGLAQVTHDILAKEFSSVDATLSNIRDEFGKDVATLDRSHASQHLKFLDDSSSSLRTLQILNAAGVTVASSRENLVGIDFSKRDYFVTPSQVSDPDKLFISDPFETVLGVYSINLTKPIVSPEGKFAGVVTGTLDPEYFSVLMRAILWASDMQTGIASKDGIVLLSLPLTGTNLGKNIAGPGSVFAKHRDTGWTESVWMARGVLTNEDRLIVIRDTLTPAYLDKPLNFSISRKSDAIFKAWREKAVLLISLYVFFSALLTSTVFVYHRYRRRSDSQIRLLSSIVEQSPVSVVVTNTDGSIHYVNKAFTETTGYSPNEVLGKNPRILQSGHTSPEVYRDLWTTLRGGSAWRGEFLNRIKSGATIWERVAIFPIKDEAGTSLQYVAIKENVTKGKEVQSELIDAKEKAEASDRAKSTFLAMMGHELRTPLNAVIGFAEMMRKQTLGPLGRPQYIEYAEDIEKSGRHLLDILNDMLDLAKLETGKFTPELQPRSLVRTVKGLASVMSSMAADAGHVLIFNIDNDATVSCEQRAVRQILLNLVSNSAKYTNRGGEIQVNVVPRPDGKVDLSVKDNGIGMARDDIKRSTDLFTRLDHRMSRATEGVGIGLYMVRRLAEQMNASLDIQSEVGVGTTVTVTFTKAEPG